MYNIIRNNTTFGPYSIDALAQYVANGQILHCDQASDVQSPNDIRTVGYFLKLNKRKVKVQSKGSLSSQIKTIGRELIIPSSLINKQHWVSDKRLLILAIVGLSPLLLIMPLSIINVDYLTFYAISLYFSVIWGLFFYYLFRTPQVTIKRTLAIFFITQAFVFLFFGLGINYLNFVYALKGSENFFIKLIFYIFAVGVTEEFSKAVPIYLTVAKAKEPLIPQTLVYYGLMSGIAFGVFEGVEYQLGVNIELDYSSAFFMNIARLTSLPFLHAVWAGIGAYFISFAKLYPLYRKSLYFLSLAIPALLHGVYDVCSGYTFGFVISMITTILAVVLLMTYLKQGVNMQSKLKN